MGLVLKHAPDPRSRQKTANEAVDVRPLQLVEALIKAKRQAACHGLRSLAGDGGDGGGSRRAKSDEQQRRQQRRRQQLRKNNGVLLGK